MREKTCKPVRYLRDRIEKTYEVKLEISFVPRQGNPGGIQFNRGRLLDFDSRHSRSLDCLLPFPWNDQSRTALHLFRTSPSTARSTATSFLQQPSQLSSKTSQNSVNSFQRPQPLLDCSSRPGVRVSEFGARESRRERKGRSNEGRRGGRFRDGEGLRVRMGKRCRGVVRRRVEWSEGWLPRNDGRRRRLEIEGIQRNGRCRCGSCFFEGGSRRMDGGRRRDGEGRVRLRRLDEGGTSRVLDRGRS